jgi:transposase
VGRVKESEEGAEVVWIELLPRADRLKVCSCCRQPADAIHDREERWIQDLPLFDAPVELLVHRCRVNCKQCGPKLEQIKPIQTKSRYFFMTT